MKPRAVRQAVASIIVGAMVANNSIPAVLAVQPGEGPEQGNANHADRATATPIEHAIIIIGENRTFDHVFATYKPVHRGERVDNLLSKGIVNADGTPGPNYAAALQYSATDTVSFELDPAKTPYGTLPPALTGGPATPAVCAAVGDTGTSCASDPKAMAAAQSA